MPDSPVKYPVTKNNPNYLFCNFPWFGLVSIRIKSNVSLLNWPKCVFSECLMYMNVFFAFLHKRIFRIQPIILLLFIDPKIIYNLFPKIVVEQNALQCELFYFHFRFPRFRE